MYQIDISEASYEGGYLKLKTSSYQAKNFIRKFKSGEYIIEKFKQKRSLNANSYMWELCRKIANEVRISKEEVYRDAVKDGNAFVQLDVTEKQAKKLERTWGKKGIGWQTERADTKDDNVLLFCYYGSSVYDTKEMSDLIDRLLQDCKALDIEVLSEYEIHLLKEGWQ